MKVTNPPPPANHPPPRGIDLVVAGTSARWLAASSRRANLQCWAWDLFGDADLQEVAPVRTFPDLQAVWQALSTSHLQLPILFGSGWESLVGSGTVTSLLPHQFNCSPSSVRFCRDPDLWSRLLDEHEVRVPAWHSGAPPSHSATQPPVAEWLCKPRHSSGGQGIQRVARLPTDCLPPFNPTTHFLQQWIPGQPRSGVFLARDGRATALGLFHQCLGLPCAGAQGEFQYCGSIGPISVSSAASHQTTAIADLLVEQAGLVGLFGIDFVETDCGQWVPVEINPRPTASCELLERQSGTSLLPLHLSAFPGPSCFRKEPATVALPSGHPAVSGRLTLFWPGTTPQTIPAAAQTWIGEQARLGLAADLPAAGTWLQPAAPILTLFADGQSQSEVMEKMKAAAESCLQRLME